MEAPSYDYTAEVVAYEADKAKAIVRLKKDDGKMIQCRMSDFTCAQYMFPLNSRWGFRSGQLPERIKE